MFNQLRNRLLIVNMVIISLIMIVAFSSIYTITYQYNHKTMNNDFIQVSDFYRKSGGMNGGGKFGDNHGPKDQDSELKTPSGDIGIVGNVGGGGGKLGPQPERSVSFAINTDADWNITKTDSRFDMDDDFYKLAVEHASSSDATRGNFTLDGNRWEYNVENTVEGYSIVFMDVTNQYQFLRNLLYTFLAVGLIMLVVIYFTSRYFANRSIAPVKEAFDKQQRFIADASHELRTPLAVINTNADVLLANSDDIIRTQMKWLNHIKSETERMRTLTSDLLYLTQMEDAREGVIMTSFNLSEAVENIILTLEAVIFEKNMVLDYDISPDLYTKGNSEQMKQVILILLDNAIKYTNAGGSIKLTLKKHGHDQQLTVTNTGEGIPQEHLARIFDRFYRVDASRSRQNGGYGLGLAIAKTIVEQSKGRISAKSVLNETTSFTVQLPADTQSRKA
ncbi:phospho-acceptor domain-containing protein [Paenibacillus cellulosilyticus]|uniref:histidine kinase n=1 Tax=Paenibacillus cellulosilyticus TaxID=375489 RepID=A0A2V2YH00_9BACL|nr:ATP-binding protein [Paenibacillus cellulosilyticus]PWV92477.1 phospho-acceptor domain-containing protein [Paenibacillus cellulosilyticus]QKS47050.1 GHKL domain-containing protein [Paenibacillus cellulosilyticus]